MSGTFGLSMLLGHTWASRTPHWGPRRSQSFAGWDSPGLPNYGGTVSPWISIHFGIPPEGSQLWGSFSRSLLLLWNEMSRWDPSK